MATVPSASAASASAAQGLVVVAGEYEVFLSFRGADTRYGFTDYLYNDLIGAGARTFRDDNELRVGEEIGPELLRAIKDSKISIPIFSKNYASSKWCLRELAQMVECKANGGQMIYPIFYDVEPSEVQHQSGSYKEAFHQYEKSESLDEKIVKQWKAALEIVGDLKGLELKKKTNWCEGELVKIVVEEVLFKLKKHYQHLPKNLVGIDSHIEEMEGLLNGDSNGLRTVGILGMGGLGKTTIAKVIYNKLSEHFECRCFLEDVQEKSQLPDGIVNLQTQLLSQILKREISKIDGDYKGLDRIKDAVHGKKVFLVLDDVDKMSQIEKLVGNHNWYDARSRIVITTRNKEVLEELELTCQKEGLHEVFASYEPDFMNDDDSLKLFSKYAFKEDSAPEGYDDLATEVVRTASGLPLVLVTLGSLLFIEKDRVSWQEKLKKLKALPPKEVLGRLRISYDALDDMQQQIFLDIACLFSGEDKTIPCYMWDDCEFSPSEGINALIRRSLITVGDDNKLWMHDQLIELGKQIISKKNRYELGKWCRLWRSKDASNVLKKHLGTENIKVLCLSYKDFLDGFEVFEDFESFQKSAPRIAGQDFCKLPNLRFLKMDFLDLDGDFKNLLQNLRWLQCWHCSGNGAPTNLNLENLVVLDLSKSRCTDDWVGWSQIKMSKKLKVLTLSGCSYLSRAPHLSAFTTLERLELVDCQLLSRLDGLEELGSLKYLNTVSCYALESLPDLSKLRKLQTLNVAYCKKLTTIQGLDKMESLELLDASYCDSLERLPNLSNLNKLTRFESPKCKKLVEFQGLDRLVSLEHLDISRCKSLRRLMLTEDQGLGGLEFSEYLNMKDWEHIERLPDLSKLRWLRKLKISSCRNLIEIQGLHGLESLKHLDMHKCRSIKRLLGLSNLKRLKKLDISKCDELIEIQDLDGLESLEILDMHECKSVERLPNLSSLRKLKSLDIRSCYMLVEIQGLDRLESLEKLDMRSCKSIEILPDLPNFGMLKNIDLFKCKMLQDVETLRVAESLESLNVSFCKALKKMPDLRILKKLKTLDFCYLKELTEIRGLEELKSLELLDVCGCKSIENLPDFANLTNLKVLDVSKCAKLTEIRGLEELKFLTELSIVGCDSLKNLQNLPNTTIQRD